MFQTLTLCAVLSVPAAAPTVGADKVELAWRLPEGAVYRVETSAETISTTTAMETEQSETMEQRRTNHVRVVEVDGRGNMRLSMTTQSLFMRKESSMMTIRMSATRDEDGKPDVDATVTTEVPGFETASFESFFEAVGANLLDLEYAIHLSPDGSVIESSVDGDPFASLPADDLATSIAKQAIELMISPDELAETAVAEMFVKLPAGFVEVAGDWPVQHDMNSVGVAMSGTGRTRLDELRDEGGAQVAVLKRDLRYKVDTDGLEEKMEELMALSYAQAGIDLDFGVDLSCEPLDSASTVEWDVAGGFCRSIRWEEMRLPMTGTIRVGPQAVDMDMHVEIANSRASWSRVEPR